MRVCLSAGLFVDFPCNSCVWCPDDVMSVCLSAGPFVDFPCNSFVWCPDEVCFEPDAHKHTKGDCWLKWTEGPAYPEVSEHHDELLHKYWVYVHAYMYLQVCPAHPVVSCTHELPYDQGTSQVLHLSTGFP
jgi:hypothetical protein